jgi:hypothetical protein
MRFHDEQGLLSGRASDSSAANIHLTDQRLRGLSQLNKVSVQHFRRTFFSS